NRKLGLSILEVRGRVLGLGLKKSALLHLIVKTLILSIIYEGAVERAHCTLSSAIRGLCLVASDGHDLDLELLRATPTVVDHPQDHVLIVLADHVADVRAEQSRERLRRHPRNGVVPPPLSLLPVKEVTQRALGLRDPLEFGVRH